MKNYFGTLNSADDHLLRNAISANNYGWVFTKDSTRGFRFSVPIEPNRTSGKVQVRFGSSNLSSGSVQFIKTKIRFGLGSVYQISVQVRFGSIM